MKLSYCLSILFFNVSLNILSPEFELFVRRGGLQFPVKHLFLYLSLHFLPLSLYPVLNEKVLWLFILSISESHIAPKHTLIILANNPILIVLTQSWFWFFRVGGLEGKILVLWWISIKSCSFQLLWLGLEAIGFLLQLFTFLRNKAHFILILLNNGVDLIYIKDLKFVGQPLTFKHKFTKALLATKLLFVGFIKFVF